MYGPTDIGVYLKGDLDYCIISFTTLLQTFHTRVVKLTDLYKQYRKHAGQTTTILNYI